jgi:carbon storage regulator
MLVLARKSSEIIRIGEDIIIKVISIRGGQVKIGIEAPKGIRVTRGGPGEHVARQERGNGADQGGQPPAAPQEDTTQ